MTVTLREEITTLAEYTLVQPAHRIKLNQNENPFELPRHIKEQILRRVGEIPWSRYPPFVPAQQMDQVARFTGWLPDGVLLGNGSNDLLQLLITCMLERGSHLVLSQPTFTLYRLLARSLGAIVHDVPMQQPFAFDTGRIIETARTHGAALVVLCSPNNPTGTRISGDDVLAILEKTEAVVALDEAYVQFCGGSLVPLLAHHDRLVILQTFSKAMGAAGLRFGYLLGSPDLTANLNKVKLPYSVNLFTLTAMEVLMNRWQEIRGWIDTIVAERDRVFRVLEETDGVQVHPSWANFLLLEMLRKSPKEVFQSLLGHGILVRDVSSYPLLGRALRVSIGTPEENDAFIAALREAV